MISDVLERVPSRRAAADSTCDLVHAIFSTENLVHQDSNAVNILVTDLHEDGTALRQQITGNRESVSQIREVRMDAVAPCVSEGSHLLGFAGDVLGLAVSYITAGGRPLEVGIELDAIGRIDVDALHLAAQPFALRETDHHLQAVAEDHPVRPVHLVLVELGLGVGTWKPVEVGEQFSLEACLGSCVFDVLFESESS